jgi:hypothetical protein
MRIVWARRGKVSFPFLRYHFFSQFSEAGLGERCKKCLGRRLGHPMVANEPRMDSHPSPRRDGSGRGVYIPMIHDAL